MMTDDRPRKSHLIEGLVAGVLSERELTINVGSAQGVKLGTKFRVLANEPIEVPDPETGEVLGTVAHEKVRVRAVEVKPRFSVCRTYRVRTTRGGPLYYIGQRGQLTAPLTAPPREIPETLKAEDADYLQNELSEEESFVKRGDHVIEIFDDD